MRRIWAECGPSAELFDPKPPDDVGTPEPPSPVDPGMRGVWKALFGLLGALAILALAFWLAYEYDKEQHRVIQTGQVSVKTVIEGWIMLRHRPHPAPGQLQPLTIRSIPGSLERLRRRLREGVAKIAGQVKASLRLHPRAATFCTAGSERACRAFFVLLDRLARGIRAEASQTAQGL